MKEKIYTIPVNDAYQSGCACPLCQLEADVEKSTLEYFLGVPDGAGYAHRDESVRFLS